MTRPQVLIVGPEASVGDVRTAARGVALVVLAAWAPGELAEDLRKGVDAEVVHLTDDVDDPLGTTRRRYAAVRAWLDQGSPLHRGVRVLDALETAISWELAPAVVVADLLALVRTRVGDADLRAVGPGSLASPLHAMAGVPLPDRPASGGRLARLARVTRAPGLLADAFDPSYEWRGRIGRHRRPAPGGPWCFSSYATCSAALRDAGDRPADVRWLVNNRSARAPLGGDQDVVPIWHLGRTAAARGARSEALQAILSFAAAAPEDVDGLPLRRLLADVPGIRRILDRTVPNLLAEVDLLDRFVDEVQPAEVWVANQWSAEQLLLQLARRDGIPSVQVQHGLLEEHFALSPMYADRFLVWGDWWRSLLPAGDQASIGARRSRSPVPVAPGSRRLLLCTTPLSQFRLATPLPGVAGFVAALAGAGWEVVIRVHPADDPAPWGSLPGSTIDRAPTMAAALAAADVVVTFPSTVVLEAAAAGRPVVELAWLPFPWRQAFDAAPLSTAVRSFGEALAVLGSGRFSRAPEDVLAALDGRRGP